MRCSCSTEAFDPLIRAYRGKVFFFTGMLRNCKDDDGIAAGLPIPSSVFRETTDGLVVLAHEISHTVANHSGEKLSKTFVFGLVALAAAIFGDTSLSMTSFIVHYLLTLPNSRLLEVRCCTPGRRELG